ncbi:hypothetical protein STRTUCAR8_01700 [Streptomyces turgidiscabies Car8]|uniref:Uncharacterized protein n=1 Tax=Streptomyces turgidiscabies (strain Car8) TaxID=698760 RepID=L7F3A6_STRT8|nr:hypothetical protein STRTUCAR8_01700 [Streptomyces turgidiscabies Car8]
MMLTVAEIHAPQQPAVIAPGPAQVPADTTGIAELRAAKSCEPANRAYQ